MEEPAQSPPLRSESSAAAAAERARPFWNPYVAGIALGLVLLASFVVVGKGLGSSGAYKLLGAAALQQIDPTYAEENGNIGHFFQPGRSVLSEWIVFLAIGTFIGGLLGAFTSGRFKRETIHGPRIARENRWVLAVLGGMLSGFAAQLARGCTSGQALTGGAQLALGSWVFMFSVFGGAYALAYLVRKEWI
ncbi:MAG: YeeE/YedE family protein [Deltaproteobacteria bacterium]|nr:YeeE/YedE family protein [Deltaproteobacteria bacterium]